MLSTAILAVCSKNEGGEGEPFTPPAQEQLTQNAYADNESTGGGFSFTASAPWTATVNEVQAQASALASVQTKSVTRAADNNGNNVVWLKLYNGDKEAYSGGAGTITLRIDRPELYGRTARGDDYHPFGQQHLYRNGRSGGNQARRQRERAAGQSDEDYPRQNRTFVGCRS